MNWLAWANERYLRAPYGPNRKVMLSFENRQQFTEWRRNHGRAVVVHTLENPQTGRYHAWISKR